MLRWTTMDPTRTSTHPSACLDPRGTGCLGRQRRHSGQGKDAATNPGLQEGSTAHENLHVAATHLLLAVQVHNLLVRTHKDPPRSWASRVKPGSQRSICASPPGSSPCHRRGQQAGNTVAQHTCRVEQDRRALGKIDPG
jgi:hypothetical protein